MWVTIAKISKSVGGKDSVSAVVCLSLHASRVNYFLINRLFRFVGLMALADYHRQPAKQQPENVRRQNKMVQYSPRSHADRLRYTFHRLSSTFIIIIIIYLLVSYDDDDDERRTSHACILHICYRATTANMTCIYSLHYVDFFPRFNNIIFCALRFFAQNTFLVVHDRRSVEKTFNKKFILKQNSNNNKKNLYNDIYTWTYVCAETAYHAYRLWHSTCRLMMA